MKNILTSERVHTLYVIGNGFDAYHGINSRYPDYRQWLIDNKKLSEDVDIETYFESDCDLWSNFEENLSRLNWREFAIDSVAENPPNSSSEHFENTLTDGTAEVENQMEAWWKVVKGSLSEWVQALTARTCSKRLCLNTSGTFFLSFNYTRTLEDLYGINPKKVLHIHGVLGDSKLEFGHGGLSVNVEGPADKTQDNAIEDDDMYGTTDANVDIANQWAEASAQRIANQWEKPVSKIIQQNEVFFSSLRTVERVVFLGFGFSKVDNPYVQKIKNAVRQDARWFTSWHTQQDIMNILRDLGPDVKLLKLDELVSKG